MQRKFVIRGKEFLFRDPDPNDNADFQYLDNFYKDMKELDSILDVNSRNKESARKGQDLVLDLLVEPKSIDTWGIIEDKLIIEVVTWISDKISGIIREQKKN
jgi:hypothetical protein